ncbi:hypothetical protein L208DRAFT_1462916 [Tricholoma matsutake]|nr:hypothetical protein L208DRAFT_1462916 [Tricholoma matsutake 945]
MQKHAQWEAMANEFRTAVEEEQMGLLNWKAWKRGKKVWATAKVVQQLANRTSAAAIRDHLRCRGSHRTKSDGCYFCAEQDLASASTSPEPAQPQDETFNSLLISHPIVHVDVDMNSLPAGYQSEHGLLPMYLCVMPTARVDCVPSPSHFKLAATPPDTPPNVDVLAGTT